MFKIKRKDGKGLVETVYSVKEDKKQGTMFLIHDAVGWLWVDARKYKPFMEES